MIKSPSNVFSEFGVSADEMQRALNSSFLTINEMREMFGLNSVSIEESIFKSGGPSGSRDSGVKQMTIRRAVHCQNCGANEYTDNGGAFVCNYCGTTYEKRDK